MNSLANGVTAGDEVTTQVRNLYEQYPFPAPYATSGPLWLEGVLNYTWLYYQNMNEYREVAGRWILDAGCGTGETLTRYAVNNSGARLVGFDLSDKSLELARAKLAAQTGVDCTLEQRDILRLPAPDRQYDLISCTGVLHHLASPLQGLRNLTTYLKPDGLINIYLYSSYARRHISMLRDIIAMLSGPSLALDKRILLARQLIASLPAEHVLVDFKRFDFDVLSWIERDENVADMFLHPHEVAYTFDQMMELLDAAELELVSFADEHNWELRTLLHPELYRRALFMSRKNKYRLADLLMPHSTYTFWARHRACTPKSRPTVEDDKAWVPVVSPTTASVIRQPLGNYPNLEPDVLVEVHGVQTRRYRLDRPAQQTLLLCDGVRSISDIAATMAEATHTDNKALYVKLLTTLEEQRIVFFRPR